MCSTHSGGLASRSGRRSSLSSLTSCQLRQLLARIGGLLEDNTETTRRMGCLSFTLLFDGLILPPADSTCTAPAHGFCRSSTWLLSEDRTNRSLEDAQCPEPNSLGDQVYRLYPNLTKCLNDTKNTVSLLWYKLAGSIRVAIYPIKWIVAYSVLCACVYSLFLGWPFYPLVSNQLFSSIWKLLVRLMIHIRMFLSVC